jgi:hypothetical protein
VTDNALLDDSWKPYSENRLSHNYPEIYLSMPAI